MGIPELNQTCCGCSLKTGSKIVGWFSLISQVFWLLVGISFFYWNFGTHKGSSEDGDLAWVGIIIIVVVLIGMIFTILLLIGITKVIPRYLIWWVWLSTVRLVVLVLCTLISALYLMSTGYYVDEGIEIILGAAFVFSFSAYVILVVYNHYRELKGDNRGYGVHSV